MRLHQARGGIAPRKREKGALVAFLGILLVWLSLVAAPARADSTYPAFTGLVVDDAHVLSDADKAAITAKLQALQAKTGIQFAVATVASLGGEEIEPYANALFRKWKIGQKGVDNGLLLILAPRERKLRFEVGYGLEGTFTDVQSKLILHNTMVPKLKAGDPAGALKAGVDDAVAVLTKANQPEGTAQDTPAATSADTSDNSGTIVFYLFLLIPLVVILIFVVLIIQTLRGKIHWRSGPGGWSTGGSSSAGGWSSGDSSSSSSGGGDNFSGGGGGDSGGGGASDSY